tara:strand:- start:4271 stop:4528 length:258 start_codon:yes stop_codon:yes gene_type:complete
MKKYTIDKTFWASPNKDDDIGHAECIGIAEFRLPCNVKIKDKTGRYIITKEFALKYPRRFVKDMEIPLRIIPVKELIPNEEGNIM